MAQARLRVAALALNLDKKLEEGLPELAGGSTALSRAGPNLLPAIVQAASLMANNPAALSAPGEHPGPKSSSVHRPRFTPPPQPAADMEHESAAAEAAREKPGEVAVAPADTGEAEAWAETMAEVGAEASVEPEAEATLPPYPKSYGNNMQGEKKLARQP